MLADHRNLTHLDNQRGWVLVVGLVILVMLTILSMALMKTTRLEEKMAGATRDMNLSFQAAETALRAAETFIESKTNESFFSTTDKASGIYGKQDNEPEDLSTIDWNVYSAEIDEETYGELEGVTLLPRYMIKKLKKKIDDATVFRITVRGTGGTNNRATLLRSHYAKKFGAGSSGPEGRLSWEQLFPSQ
jgi:type IV pilus assembly protein PilX